MEQSKSHSGDSRAPFFVRLGTREPATGGHFGFQAGAITQPVGESLLLGDEMHVMTIAPTGAGKTVSCTVPVLLQYPGPMVVFDCKGELAEVTARQRQRMGQEVLVVDPLRITSFTPARFNPLDIVEPDALDAADEARALAEVLLPDRYDSRDAFWRGRGLHFLTAGMLHAVHDLPKRRRNLVTLRDIVQGMGKGIGRNGQQSSTPEGIVSRHPEVMRLNDLMGFGSPETLGGMLHFAMDGVGFIRGDLIEDSLSGSDVPLDAVTEGAPMTIYLVLPPHLLQSHQALLRSWFGSIFAALFRRRTRPAVPTLLILDEAAQLGTFGPLRTAITLLRGYGMQTWSFWQDPSQISTHYPQDHRTLINNCGLIEAFGAKGAAAWSQVGDLLGQDVSRFGQIAADQMLIQSEGQLEVARRIDYRMDTELAPLADPNPIYSPTQGTLRRSAPQVPQRNLDGSEKLGQGELLRFVEGLKQRQS
jgi:type IV secretion system protein VirD4